MKNVKTGEKPLRNTREFPRCEEMQLQKQKPG